MGFDNLFFPHSFSEESKKRTPAWGGGWGTAVLLQETCLSEEGEGNHREQGEEKGKRYLFAFARYFGRVGTSRAAWRLGGLHGYF